MGPGRGNPPIRASARLTVNCKRGKIFSVFKKYLHLSTAVPPTSIQILNHLAGAKVEVKQNEEVEISCRVANAKPVAKIIWYRNNVVFNPGVGGYIIYQLRHIHISTKRIRN